MSKIWYAYIVVYLILSAINWSLWIGHWGWFGRAIFVVMIIVHILTALAKRKTENS